MGDVNSSATLFGQNPQAEIRIDKYVYLLLKNKKLEQGEQVTIPFFAKDFKEITGYQMALGFDDSAMKFIESKSNLIQGFPKEFFGTNDLEKGLLLLNWVAGKAESIEDETELFQLVFEAKKETSLEDVFKITDQELQTEAYNEQKEHLRIGLEFFDEIENSFSNISFSPNPFSEIIQLNIRSEVTEEAEIIFYDEVGKVLKSQILNVQEGVNSLEFDFSSNEYSGLVFYRIKSKSGHASGKLVKL